MSHFHRGGRERTQERHPHQELYQRDPCQEQQKGVVPCGPWTQEGHCSSQVCPLPLYHELSAYRDPLRGFVKPPRHASNNTIRKTANKA